MPSAAQGPTVPLPHPTEAVPVDPTDAALQLALASRALWSATLALMTAFMQTRAPAHRYLLASRVARNFGTLAQQDCFDAACRERFRRLARRWEAQAAQFAPQRQTPPRPRGLLRFLS